MFLLDGEQATQVFAVTRTSLVWQTIGLGADDLAKKVAAFRRGLDVEQYEKSVANGQPILFDLGVARDLYAKLLQPVESALERQETADRGADRRTRGAAVPYCPGDGMLRKQAIRPLWTAYRNAAWLIKRHAISVLPSVASLKSLRALSNAGPWRQAADRLRRSDLQCLPRKRPLRRAAVKVVSGPDARAVATIGKASASNRSQLAQDLPRLADTADELLRRGSKNLVHPKATSICGARCHRDQRQARCRSPTIGWSISPPTASWPATSRAWPSPRWR